MSDTELAKAEKLKPEILESDMSELETMDLTEKKPAADTSQLPAPGLVAVLSGIMFVGSMSTGIITIAIPIIADDLALPESLLLWFVALREERVFDD